MITKIHIIAPTEIKIEAKKPDQISLRVQGGSGAPGKTAYQVWLSEGNTGTVQDYLNSLQGPQGFGVASGGNEGNLLEKASPTDGDTRWLEVPNFVLWYNNQIQ